MMGAERRSMVMTEDEKKLTAYHEAGHALVAMHMPGQRSRPQGRPSSRAAARWACHAPAGSATAISLAASQSWKPTRGRHGWPRRRRDHLRHRASDHGRFVDIKRRPISRADGDRVGHEREAGAAALRRAEPGGFPGPLGHPAQERVRRHGRGDRLRGPPASWTTAYATARSPDREPRSSFTRWPRGCWNTRPCRARRSMPCCAASPSSAATSRTLRRPLSSRRRDDGRRFRPAAARTPVVLSRNPSRERKD